MSLSGGGDSYYISEGRRIQENVQQLLFIASELGAENGANGGWLKGRLNEAKTLANETHQMLKNFGVTTSESSRNSAERSQRRDTYRKLNRRYQAALKTLDESAQAAICFDGVKNRGNARSLPTGLVNGDGSSSLFPDSAMAGWDSDLSSQTSSSVTANVSNFDGKQKNMRPLCRNENNTRDTSKRPTTLTTHPLDPYPRNHRTDDFYQVAQPQLEINDISASSDSWNESAHRKPLHQQVLTYPSQRYPKYHTKTFYDSAVELRDTTAGTASTAAPTVRSCSMESQRDLEFFPMRMVRADELQARLLAEEARGVLQIEKDVKGIRQLYQDMAWQVSNEGDDIDAIESQMRTAADLSARAVVDTRNARSMLQSHYRFKYDDRESQ